MHGKTWRSVFVLAVFAARFLPSLVIASSPVPSCRLDDELAPAVRLAVQWGLQDLKKIGAQLPFDDVAINPRGAVPARTLPIYIVKDASTSTVDQKGCIKPMRVGSTPFYTDGPCVGTKNVRDVCSQEDLAYMVQRFIEIHGFSTGDSQIGYEQAGACYMTNQQACFLNDRLDLIDALGPRDVHSVKGTCVASAKEPVEIRCSAGALKWLLSSEAVAKKATSLAIVLVLGHELGHLVSGHSSSYDASDNEIDLAWPSADKIARIQIQCRTGESLRKRERDADEVGLRIAKQRLPEIARTWPQQGTIAWLITQAVYQSTHLARWNNGWLDGPEVELPRVFQMNPGGGILRISGEELEAFDAGKSVSGRSPQEVQLAARKFLCDVTELRTGRWDVLIQSGSTHGTLVERLGELLGSLRSVKGEKDSSIESTEALLGRISDAVGARHRAYLRELEGAICTLVEQPLDCSQAALRPDVKPAPASDAPTKSGGSRP